MTCDGSGIDESYYSDEEIDKYNWVCDNIELIN